MPSTVWRAILIYLAVCFAGVLLLIANAFAAPTLPDERDQRHFARLSRLETHRGAGGDIEPHAARLLALELERRVGLEEMIVRADLDRPVAGIGDAERHPLAPGVEGNLAVLDEHFAGDHQSTAA